MVLNEIILEVICFLNTIYCHVSNLYLSFTVHIVDVCMHVCIGHKLLMCTYCVGSGKVLIHFLFYFLEKIYFH